MNTSHEVNLSLNHPDVELAANNMTGPSTEARPVFYSVDETTNLTHNIEDHESQAARTFGKLKKGVLTTDAGQTYLAGDPEAFRIETISKWTPEEVGVWLNCVNFGDYRQEFMSHDISGVDLLNLPANKDHLPELGVQKLAHRFRLLELIGCLKSGQLERMMILAMTPISSKNGKPKIPESEAKGSPLPQSSSPVASDTSSTTSEDRSESEHHDHDSFTGLIAKKYADRQLKVLMKKEDPLTKIFAWYVEIFTLFLFIVAALLLLCMWTWYAKVEAFVGTFICQSIAGVAYLWKSLHMGDAVIFGKTVPVVRYIDWITTTPIMLYEITHIAHADFQTMFMIISCDLLTLTFGITSAMLDHHLLTLKTCMFLLAGFFYIIMVATLNIEVSQKFAAEQSDHVRLLFERLEVLTVVTWSCYPCVVLLGRAHSGLISKSQEDVLLCILDILSKIGMEGLIVVHAATYHGNTDTSYGSSYSAYSA